MNIFFLYMKIARSQWRSLCMYLCIFCAIFVVWGMNGIDNTPITYSQMKPDITLIDHDQSDLSDSITSYLKERATLHDIGTSESELKDALYFGQITYIVEIPKGFEQAFIQQKKMNLVAQTKPDDVNAVLLNQSLNAYLKNIRIYQKMMPAASVANLHKRVTQDMKKEVKMEMANDSNISDSRIFRASFFKYMSYILMALTILVIGMTMNSINKSEIKMRNLVSSITNTKMNTQLLLADFTFGIGYLACFIIIVLLLCSHDMFNISGLLYIVNAFVFMLVCVTMSYMISMIVGGMRNAENALNGISNLVSLGSSFLCGAFVPQMFLSEGILKIASFLPAYWYIKLCDTLQSVTTIDDEQWMEIGKCLGIQLLFVASFLVLALVITKNKRSVQQIADTTK